MVREEDEARRQKWAEEDRERTQTAREDEIQRRLRQSLVTHTEQWERAERLRRFIKAVELRQEAMPSPDQAKAWLAWAREQANRLDPLQQELGEVTELAVELESWFSESSFGRKEKDWWG
uniref:hypothetical protein n=1 Tax=unclassified Pseudomonas TaxID=196821 RepID=UPI00069F8376|nr:MULTISPECIES: hypothetical protein [unclassified Pseudomonas]MBY8946651.1 hypothetical protein [Pseudomonas sp. SH10-3B]